MSVGAKLVTAEEFLKVPSENGRMELIEGDVVTMTPGGEEHGNLIFKVTIPVGAFIEQRNLGRCYGAETGFIVHRDPDTVRAPDFSFVSKQKLHGRGLLKGFIPGAPDLAVEVVSPDDSLVEVEDKVVQWLAAGSEQVWVINPRRKSVSIYTSPTQVRILTVDDQLDGGTLLPGFTYPVAKLFE